MGSSSENNIVVHNDKWGMNFSDSPENQLPYVMNGTAQPISPWDVYIADTEQYGWSLEKARGFLCGGKFDEHMNKQGISSDVMVRINAIKGNKHKLNEDGSFTAGV